MVFGLDGDLTRRKGVPNARCRRAEGRAGRRNRQEPPVDGYRGGTAGALPLAKPAALAQGVQRRQRDAGRRSHCAMLANLVENAPRARPAERAMPLIARASNSAPGG